MRSRILREYCPHHMGSLARRTCRRCGRTPIGERLVDGHCLRCRALALVDGFDDALAGHARRVTMLAIQVADELRLAGTVRRDVELGGLLHDIGKLTIPAAILAKAGPLDEGETELMRTHVTEGERLAEGLAELPASVPAVVRSSHERWDGDGYPDRLHGEAIPLAARIVSCADAFDAMTSSRSYRPALGTELALDVIRQEAGRQFDPGVAAAFVVTVGRWRLEIEAEPMASAFDSTLRRLRRAPARSL
jgi:HD-GYP domain-containing protein (c-di-GMP phosphodiesterase class II)